MSTESPIQQTVPCKACRQPLHAEATKCQHCGEPQARPFPIERTLKRCAGWIGLATAFLSAFYALREGYYYIEQRQQQREVFTAHLNVAERFIALDNLEYAESSLSQALKLNPNDNELRLKYFFLRSRNLLRDVDYFGGQLPDERLAKVPDLVTDGFSLLENEFSSVDRALVLVTLAGLLQNDRRWQNPSQITDLYREARRLAPENAITAFWYGDWLLRHDPPQPEGAELLREAVAREPKNPLFLYTLGRHQARNGDYAAAFRTLRTAIETKTDGMELQQLRSANEAKYRLRRVLTDAADRSDITGAKFHGMNLDERLSIVEFALRSGASDRRVQEIAARLLHHAGRHAAAEELLRELVGNDPARSTTALRELFADVLDARDKPAEAARVRKSLQDLRVGAGE